MNLFINLTWSKVIAFLVLGCAVFLDVRNGGASSFMYALPFVVALITGKQILDSRKPTP